ncbi:hypothetical protein [Natrialba swarupiae]|uniref:Uncharacterized protein n=1 Tax=Natrialba swarupiae TaxID=2448032 RepID=A0A5D5APP7_9EURY|nr:hypothetical protein [Natrialba swarupiae]TYT61722.1 hypothetical protein FYC77_11835 [Natrialba swarupiae]
MTSSATTPSEQLPDPLADRLEALEQRIGDLEQAVERKDERIADLETQLDRKDERIADLERRLDQHDEHLDETEKACERLERATAAALNKASANKERVTELQSRELEKGAHLREETVDEHDVEVPDGRLERLTKDDGETYFRLPESADPLDRGNVSLAYGDLLPIQQLARMHDEMRRAAANTVPTRLAAKLWQARVDDSVGDNPWENGCREIAEYVKASDLKHWIRRQETGISESYAKKLVSRVIDAMLDLSKHRLAVRKRTERKNGLKYTERRLILPADAEIPGETGGDA